jgi:hypothetical protein
MSYQAKSIHQMQTMSYSSDGQRESKFGQIVYDYIQGNGWTVEQFGALYGVAVKQKSYTKMRIYMASPQEKLHDSRAVFEALEEARHYIMPDTPRRYVYLYITDALANFDKGWYPIATQRAEEAIDLMNRFRSKLHIVRLANLHEHLQVSDYGKDIKVAELGIALMKVQHPELFAG